MTDCNMGYIPQADPDLESAKKRLEKLDSCMHVLDGPPMRGHWNEEEILFMKNNFPDINELLQQNKSNEAYEKYYEVRNALRDYIKFYMSS